jgi:uncharacterized protein (DUF58 family)
MWRSRALRDFLTAITLLGLSLFFAVGSEQALRRGERLAGQVLAVVSLLVALGVAIVFLPRLARRVNFGAWGLPFSYRVTREGGIFVLSVFLLALAAVNTGNNLLFLVLAVLLAAIPVSGTVALGSLRELSVTLEIPENVYAGEQVPVQLSLHNRKRWFPAFSILVEDVRAHRASATRKTRRRLFGFRRAPADLGQAGHAVLRHPAYFPLVPSRDCRSELVVQSFPRRGRYQVDGFVLSTRFPFGLFKRGERVPAEGEVVVYPLPTAVSAYFHLLPFLQGASEGGRSGPGESLYSIRDYAEGDSARHVDWKATARTGTLMTREFTRQEETKLCLILDQWVRSSPAESGTDSVQSPDATRFEQAVSLAAGIFQHFFEDGAELEFFSQSEYVSRGSGVDHLMSIMRSLAVVEPKTADSRNGRTLQDELERVAGPERLGEIFSEKVFKIILTSRPRGSFPSEIWRSSHVIYFDEL